MIRPYVRYWFGMRRISIKYWYRRRKNDLACFLLKLAGKVDTRMVELFCYQYVRENWNEFNEWAFERQVDESYDA